MTGIISFFPIVRVNKLAKSSTLSLINECKTNRFSHLKKYYLVCELPYEPGLNHRTLHVKQSDVASGVRPETKPLQSTALMYWIDFLTISVLGIGIFKHNCFLKQYLVSCFTNKS